MIRVLVADDHAIVREGVRRILEENPGIQVIGEAGDGHEAVKKTKELVPDVIILDYAMPGLDGLDASQQILNHNSKAKIIVLTMYSSEEYAVRLLQLGVKGFVLKASSPEDLAKAVKKVASGCIFISQSIIESVTVRIVQTSENQVARLSDRELQVLTKLALGHSTKETAGLLNLSVSTIETYRSRVLEKLTLRNNADITRFALRHRLIENE